MNYIFVSYKKWMYVRRCLFLVIELIRKATFINFLLFTRYNRLWIFFFRPNRSKSYDKIELLTRENKRHLNTMKNLSSHDFVTVKRTKLRQLLNFLGSCWEREDILFFSNYRVKITVLCCGKWLYLLAYVNRNIKFFYC